MTFKVIPGSFQTHSRLLSSVFLVFGLMAAPPAQAADGLEGALGGMTKALNDYGTRIFSGPRVDLVKAKADIIAPAMAQVDQALKEEFATSLKDNGVKMLEGAELQAIKDREKSGPKRKFANTTPSGSQNVINGQGGIAKLTPQVIQTDTPRSGADVVINGDQFPKSLVFQAKARVPAGTNLPDAKPSSAPVSDVFQGGVGPLGNPSKK